MPEPGVKDIKEMLVGRCPGLLFDLVPGLRRKGTVYFAPNPTRARDSATSFVVYKTGNWREHDGAPDEAGDILGLIAYVAHYDPKSREGRAYALKWARDRLGLGSLSAADIRRDQAEAERNSREREAQEAEDAVRKRQRALSIYRESLPLDASEGRFVRAYLEGRGLALEAIPHPAGVLRVHPRLAAWSESKGFRGVAMVAPIFTAAGLSGVHCTFLEAIGGVWGKAALPKAKLMLGDVRGGVAPIALGPSNLTMKAAAAAGVSGPCVVGEGVETCVALAMGCDLRVVAALSLNNIGFGPWDHPSVASVIVALENDVKPAALAARAEILERIRRSGKPAATMASHVGSDFADLMKAGKTP